MSNKIVNLTTYPALVGAMMRHMREQKGFSQVDAANHLGVTQPSYSRLESGRAVLSVAQLSRVCGFLGLSPSEFLQKVDYAKLSMKKMGVRVEHDQAGDMGKVIVNVLMGAALVLLIAKVLVRD
ncbi:MAG: XRE family transcriptional regulator [Acidimicrobiales bacterium]|nr:MAG: XRE family transcriptional regulator [Acidimicrobiales bacterium]